MKVFEVPEVEVVNFKKDDIIVTSVCGCVDCPECPAGSNDCRCDDSWSSNT